MLDSSESDAPEIEAAVHEKPEGLPTGETQGSTTAEKPGQADNLGQSFLDEKKKVEERDIEKLAEVREDLSHLEEKSEPEDPRIKDGKVRLEAFKTVYDTLPSYAQAAFILDQDMQDFIAGGRSVLVTHQEKYNQLSALGIGNRYLAEGPVYRREILYRRTRPFGRFVEGNLIYNEQAMQRLVKENPDSFDGDPRTLMAVVYHSPDPYDKNRPTEHEGVLFSYAGGRYMKGLMEGRSRDVLIGEAANLDENFAALLEERHAHFTGNEMSHMEALIKVRSKRENLEANKEKEEQDRVKLRDVVGITEFVNAAKEKFAGQDLNKLQRRAMRIPIQNRIASFFSPNSHRFSPE